MELTLLKSFSSIAEAELARNFLASNGIKCVMQKGGKNASAAYLGEVAGADLYVSEKDLEQANNLLDLN
ncbi:MAG: DUF2007 domain-containing protein [Patescibacteria group bacterium]|nr:DUF2007 domain-containing protein [Patescibacteria group bacterium]